MKIFYIIPLFIFSVFLLSSCEKDESLDPNPILDFAPFVRLEISKKLINFNNTDNTFFEAKLVNPSGKVARYNLYVRTSDQFGINTDYVIFKQDITTFPYTLKISTAELAQALNIPIESIRDSQNFKFYGESFESNDTKTTYYSLSQTVRQNKASKQAYSFKTQVIAENNYISPTYNKDFDSYTAP